jgi:transmembrane sensor
MDLNALDIQRLIVADISGSITAEEKAQLEELMSEYRVIRERYEYLKTELADVNTSAVREQHATSRELIDIANRRERNRVVSNWAIAASITGIVALGGLTLYRTAKQTPAELLAMQSKQVELLLGSKKYSLECPNCDIKAEGYTLHSNNKELTYSASNGKETMGSLNVPAGKSYNVRLDDGTVVYMNAESKLDFPMKFHGSKREITVSGEAYIQVAQDAEHPFIVHLPNSDVRVLGTEFNVNTYDKGIDRVSLVKGSVKMNAGKDSVLLQPGKTATLDGQALVVAAFDEDQVLGWKNGILSFSGASIDEIAETIIPRYFDMHLVIDPSASGKKFTGVIDRNKPISDFLEHLSITTEITNYTKDGVIHLK